MTSSGVIDRRERDSTITVEWGCSSTHFARAWRCSRSGTQHKIQQHKVQPGSRLRASIALPPVAGSGMRTKYSYSTSSFCERLSSSLVSYLLFNGNNQHQYRNNFKACLIMYYWVITVAQYVYFFIRANYTVCLARPRTYWKIHRKISMGSTLYHNTSFLQKLFQNYYYITINKLWELNGDRYENMQGSKKIGKNPKHKRCKEKYETLKKTVSRWIVWQRTVLGQGSRKHGGNRETAEHRG